MYKDKNFINDCIKGYSLLDEIDDYIDEWHDSDTDLSLHDFLGMTKREYSLYIQDEDYLALIVTAHKENEPIEEIIQNQISMAARSDSLAKAKRLEKWLKNEGLWK